MEPTMCAKNHARLKAEWVRERMEMNRKVSPKRPQQSCQVDHQQRGEAESKNSNKGVSKMWNKHVVVKTNFDGIHQWSQCPYEEVSFLKNPHRHIFYVTLRVPVTNDDRQLEFFMLKRILDRDIIQSLYPMKNGIYQLGDKSCEMVATEIINKFRAVYKSLNLSYMTCEVFEDNENGADVVWVGGTSDC